MTPYLIHASDYPATDRIVAATGLEPGDRCALHDDLVLVMSRYSGRRRAADKMRWRSYHRSAKAIARDANGLLQRLAAEKDSEIGAVIAADFMGARRVPDDRPLDNLKTGLRRLADIAAQEAECSRVPPRQDVSVLRHLIQHDLPAVYRRHFGREPGRSRPAEGGKPGGPYVRFVTAVLAEIGDDISPDTIDAYLK